MSFENSSISPHPSEYRFASFQHRLASYAVDLGFALLTLGIGWLIWSMIVWGEGQTPAKKILKLRTINKVTNQPASWGHMSIREILIPFTVAIASGISGGLLWAGWIAVEICFYFLKGQRTLRDYWVKTVIVNEA